jgi:glycosyltransferase involved in cell wall biosynthesis
MATVVAIPSREEAFGFVTCEAMACGASIVASSVGGLVEAISHEETGLLVPPDDPRSLGEAIARLIEDPALRTSVGRNARDRYLALYTPEALAVRWRNAWTELAERGSL